jgi:hypothetical protein
VPATSNGFAIIVKCYANPGVISMVQNCERVDWAKAALESFSPLCMSGEIDDEAVRDLICDLGHYAAIRMRMRESEVVQMFEAAIGTWIAESRAPDGEPWECVSVRIFEVQDVTVL